MDGVAGSAYCYSRDTPRDSSSIQSDIFQYLGQSIPFHPDAEPAMAKPNP
jgi:hypothetical protein